MVHLRRTAGFTLIELMVTLAVIVALLLVAVPSFRAFQQRAALKAGAEQALGLWNQARMEAAKRNAFVKVGFVSDVDEGFCLGAATTPAINDLPPVAADVDPCDCFEEDPLVVATYCNVGRFPTINLDPGAITQVHDNTVEFNRSAWREVSVVGTPTLGGGEAVAVIEPRNALLTLPADDGSISFAGPSGGGRNYRLNLWVDGLGRGRLCESNASGVTAMAEYATRRCAD